MRDIDNLNKTRNVRKGGRRGTTHVSAHTPDHNDTPSIRHEVCGLETTVPCTHNVDVHEFLDLLGWVFVRRVVLDNTRSCHTGLRSRQP